MGLVHPQRVKTQRAARAGDVLILGKPLGVGVLSAALKKDQLDAAGYAALIAATTKLNRPGADLAALDGVHALTDVTGFGLLGHTLELSRGAGLTARLRYADLPWLPGVEAFAQAGVVTGASGRNWSAYRAATSRWRRHCTMWPGTCSPTRRLQAACWCRARPKRLTKCSPSSARTVSIRRL